MMIEAGCEGLTVGQCHLPTRNPGRDVVPLGLHGEIDVSSSKPLPASGTAAMIDAVEALGSEVPGVGGGIVFDSYGGVISQVAAGDTAFVHRDAIACAQYSVTYASASPSADGRRRARKLAGADPERLRSVCAGLVPELHRSHAAQLGRGVLRSELAPAQEGEEVVTTPTMSSTSRSRFPCRRRR